HGSQSCRVHWGGCDVFHGSPGGVRCLCMCFFSEPRGKNNKRGQSCEHLPNTHTHTHTHTYTRTHTYTHTHTHTYTHTDTHTHTHTHMHTTHTHTHTCTHTYT